MLWHKRNLAVVAGGLALLFGAARTVFAEPPAAGGAGTTANRAKADSKKFLRLVRDRHDEPQAMETAIVHYVPAKEGDRPGLSVDLVGAVHVGEKPYYEQLNKEFKKYDAVLFELVADKSVVPKPGEKGRSPVSALQRGLKDFLELDFQLDDIDYTKKNFVHADMSPDEMAKSMSDRGESIWSIMIRMMAAGMAQQAGKANTSDFELLMALFDKNRAIQMKRFMADQMSSMDSVMLALEGPQGSTLITERNKAALKVLGDEIKAGKKKIAIFYGAGHLSDMEKRLIADFGLKRSHEKWLEAWNLRLPNDKTDGAKPAAAAATQPATK
jgi:hypothetical protein